MWIIILLIAIFTIIVISYDHYWLSKLNHKIENKKSLVKLCSLAIATLFVVRQLDQGLELKRLDNYNYFNRVYSDWYEDLHDHFSKQHLCNSKVFNSHSEVELNCLDDHDKSLARRYFELYAQEYYTYNQELIPSDMWTKAIHGEKCEGAAMINLGTYPFLITGFKAWSEQGAFSFPPGFKKIIDDKIEQCKDKRKQYNMLYQNS